MSLRDLLIINLTLQAFDRLFSYQAFALLGAQEANPFVGAAIANWGVIYGCDGLRSIPIGVKPMASKKIVHFVRDEIESMMDSYENDRKAAIEFVRDLLGENEYRDVLDERETAEAIQYCKGLR
jgi:hypothetical protein